MINKKERKKLRNQLWYLRNKESVVIRTKHYRQTHPDSVKQWNINYYSKERNFLRDSWARAKKRARRNHIPFAISFEDFLNHWYDHKQRYGVTCRYTGATMTFIRGTGKVTPTNLSIDRLDNSKGYVKHNIIFCTNHFNNKKGPIGINDCKKILQIYQLHKKGLRHETKRTI